jgi:hypothetical protein
MRNPFRHQKTELERFVAYLEREASGTHSSGDHYRQHELESEQEAARTLLSFANDPRTDMVTVEDLLAQASLDHEGWGMSRSSAESWVWRFRQPSS